MSGAPKLCPRCQTPVLTAQREAKVQRRFLRHVEHRGSSVELIHSIHTWLALKCDRDGRVSLTVPQLARMTRCCPRTVVYGLRALERLGEIARLSNGGGRGKPAVYQLLYGNPL